MQTVFLTKLEYYQGILFLTTNRIASIDHAFQSRIDLFLPYYDLSPAARKQVWRNFVNHMGVDRFDVSEADLERLSEIRLNGREIKNLIKSSQLLSVKTGRKVDVGRLVTLAEKRVGALELLGKHGNGSGFQPCSSALEMAESELAVLTEGYVLRLACHCF
jgi:hypothetical protein